MLAILVYQSRGLTYRPRPGSTIYLIVMFCMKSLLGCFLALLLAAAALSAPAPAAAQDLCMTHEDALAWLQKEFGEQVIGRGLTDNGQALFEILVSKDGSWSLLVSLAGGSSCVVASGQNWQRLPQDKAKPVSATTSLGKSAP